jgi:hypothetical protein
MRKFALVAAAMCAAAIGTAQTAFTNLQVCTIKES